MAARPPKKPGCYSSFEGEVGTGVPEDRRPHVHQERVEVVRQAPLRVGVPAMDTVEVLGHGRQTGIRLAGRHGAYTVGAFPHVRLTVVVGAQDVTGAVGAVRRGAAMGVQADGAF